MSFTSGNDINLLQTADSQNIGAGLGNDKYLLSAGSGLTADQVINISDVEGANTLQLIGGLTIASSKVGASVLQLTHSNGATINLNGADTFTFEIGGNPLLGLQGTVQTFSSFATDSLRTTLPSGATIKNVFSNILINADGSTTASTPVVNLPIPVSLVTNANALSVQNLATGTLSTMSSPAVAGLYSGYKWETNQLTYSFNTNMPVEYTGADGDNRNWTVLNTTERATVVKTFAQLAAFLPTTFTEVAGETGDIRFSVVDISGTQGFATYPGPGRGGDVWLNSINRFFQINYKAGDQGPMVTAHEIGQAMGLKHTYEAPVAAAGTDTNDYSVMSNVRTHYLVPVFTSANGFQTGAAQPFYHSEYALNDVAALQTVYGANMQSNLGNDVYTMPFAQHLWKTIWDAGGSDTIDASTAIGVCIVNMKDGTLSSIDMQSRVLQQAEAIASLVAQGLSSSNAKVFTDQIFTTISEKDLYTGENNLGIAKGAIIENVKTGINDDIVFDNAVNNAITTNAGNDKIYLGAGGYDTVDGGAGSDTVFLVSSLRSSIQQERFADGSYLIVGANFAAKLIGIETVTCSDGNLVLV